jgi:hypothetical protein
VRCGMTLVDPPFEGSDYFDVIMRCRSPYLAWGGASSHGVITKATRTLAMPAQ